MPVRCALQVFGEMPARAQLRDGHEREDEGYSCLSMIIDLLQSTHVLSYQPDGLSVAIGRAKVATWKYLQAVILM